MSSDERPNQASASQPMVDKAPSSQPVADPGPAGQPDANKPIAGAVPAASQATTSQAAAAKPAADALPVSTDKPADGKVPTTAKLAVDPPIMAKPKPEDEPSASSEKADSNSSAITCPVCDLVNRPGELQCSRCGAVLATAGGTRKFNPSTEPVANTSWPTGEVIVTEQAPIILEINDQWVTLPVADVLTVGRVSDVPGDAAPDVDLGPYEAGDKGVSRHHIKLKRKNILIYVIDLGSTNGTFLNGRRLVPNAERLLRNGDELQLGRLKVKVRF